MNKLIKPTGCVRSVRQTYGYPDIRPGRFSWPYGEPQPFPTRRDMDVTLEFTTTQNLHPDLFRGDIYIMNKAEMNNLIRLVANRTMAGLPILLEGGN